MYAPDFTQLIPTKTISNEEKNKTKLLINITKKKKSRIPHWEDNKNILKTIFKTNISEIHVIQSQVFVNFYFVTFNQPLIKAAAMSSKPYTHANKPLSL